ncbi:MAG TPA: phosphatidate cytidylyltransferase, partial [Chitinivibrionales bacterium]|nr:phosphatidate cytidylyltransferase [Chitinivibrionales bacterium]
INSNFSIMPGTPQPVVPGMIITIIVIVLGGSEYNRMLSLLFPRNGFWLCLVWLGTVLTWGLFSPTIHLRFLIFILLLIVAFEAIVWGKRNSGRWRRASLSFSASVFLYIAGVSVLYLFDPDFQSFFRSFPQEMLSRTGVAIVIGSVLMCDTMAYFVGSAWGKHHYSNISPNKTVEGSIAGFITAFVLCSVLWIFLRNPAYPWYIGLFMGLILGVFAQVGDLFVSLMKRYFGTKNASDILPGHGGLLDRFGSVFVAVPTLGLFLLAFASDDYVKTIDEFYRLMQAGQYQKARELTAGLDISCRNRAADDTVGRNLGLSWTRGKQAPAVVRVGKVKEREYWKADSAGAWECRKELGLRCFSVRVLSKSDSTEGGRTAWQTEFVWLCRGADSKIRVVDESNTGP